MKGKMENERPNQYLRSVGHSRRQLPQAPGVQPNGHHSSHPSTGSATSPTTSVGKTPPLDALPNLNKPVPAVPMYTNGSVQGADLYGGTQPADGTSDVREYVARKPSVRPPGALAPVIPGLSSSSYDESSLVDLYAEDPQRPYSSHRQQDPDQLRHSDSFLQPNSRFHSDVYNEASRINDNQSTTSSDPHPHCKCQSDSNHIPYLIA